MILQKTLERASMTSTTRCIESSGHSLPHSIAKDLQSQAAYPTTIEETCFNPQDGELS